MTHNSEDNSIPKRSSQGSDAFSRSSAVPIEDAYSSTNNVKRRSNDQFSDKDEMRMKRQVNMFPIIQLFIFRSIMKYCTRILGTQKSLTITYVIR